jgi:hypothetical protein
VRTDAGALNRAAIAALVYGLLGVVLTHPLWQHLAAAVPSDIGDPLLNAWTLAWDTHALLTYPARLFDANIFFPLPNTLAYSEHLLATALLTLPLQGITGEPLIAYNVSLLASFMLSGLGMYLLVAHWTSCRGAAFVAGLAFAFAPYRLAAISHLQLLTVQWLPFSLLAIDRLFETAGWPDARGRTVTAGSLVVLFGLLQILSSWYLAVFSAIVIGVYALARLVTVTRQARVGRVVVWLMGCGVAIVLLVAPLAAPYLNLLPQLRLARPSEMAASLAARPGDYLAAAPSLRLVGPLTERFRNSPGFTEEHNLYPGLLVGILALLGLATAGYRGPGASRGRLVHSLALAIMLTSALALTFAGPHAILARLIPVLSVVRAPVRWMIPATLALAGLAGFGLAWLTQVISEAGRFKWSGRLTPFGVTIIASVWLLAESLAVPLPLAMVGAAHERAPVYRVLQALTLDADGSAGAVVELPMHVAPAPEYPETRRMVASCLGWWGLVNGYSGYTPPRQAALADQLAGFPSAPALATLRDLAGAGVRYLVVHPSEAPFDPHRWQTTGRLDAERGTTLQWLGDFGPDVLYAINPYGDALVTDQAAVHDQYWAARLPTLTEYTFFTGSGDIRLLAYRVDDHLTDPANTDPAARQLVRLTLYWQTTARVESDFTVFVHSLDVNGLLSGQADAPPLGNRYPTSAWLPGEIVQDIRLAPAGHAYRVGLYDLATGDRLPVSASDGTRMPDDAVTIFSSKAVLE